MMRQVMTERDLQRVVDALEDYVAVHGHPPCPAALTAGLGDGSFGQPVSANCAGGSHPGTTLVTGAGTSPVRIGALPVAVLGVSTELAFDQWGHRLLYAASADPDKPGGIHVRNQSGDSLISPSGSADFIVLSHGPTGEGAYTRAGVQKSACPGNTFDGQNCKHDRVFKVAEFSRAETTFFDDIVRFSSTPQLIPAGALMAFDLDECPPGWSEMPETHGRTIVGTGTLDDESYGLGDQGGTAFHTLQMSELPKVGWRLRLQFSRQDDPRWEFSSPQDGMSLLPNVNFNDEDNNRDEPAYTTRYLSRTVRSGHPGSGRYTVDFPTQFIWNPVGGNSHDIRQPYLSMRYCRKD